MKIEKYMETVQNLDVCWNMKASRDDNIKWIKSVSDNVFLIVLYTLFHMWFIEKHKIKDVHMTKWT